MYLVNLRKIFDLLPFWSTPSQEWCKILRKSFCVFAFTCFMGKLWWMIEDMRVGKRFFFFANMTSKEPKLQWPKSKQSFYCLQNYTNLGKLIGNTQCQNCVQTIKSFRDYDLNIAILASADPNFVTWNTWSMI